MKRFILAPLAALFGLLALSAGQAAAQNTYPYQPPRFGPGYQTQLSPYLNMLVPGNAAVNYYGLVQPQFQQRRQNNMFQSQLQGLTNLLPAPPRITERDITTPMPSTGHLTVFGYTGMYFGGVNQLPRAPRNPFPQRPGQGSSWLPPAGQPPVRPR